MARDQSQTPGQPGPTMDGLPPVGQEPGETVRHMGRRIPTRVQPDPPVNSDAMGPPVAINLPGVPQQQGSKTRGASGHTYEANKNLAPWRADAITACRIAYDGPPITDPLLIDATFMFPRPRAHFGTGRNRYVLKPSAPIMKATVPDLDKLQRAVGDALTQAGVITDDRLIVTWHARKCWTSGRPETVLMIWRVEP